MTAALNQLGVVFTPYAWLGHLLIAIPLLAAVALPLRLARVPAAWWIAAACNAGFWWGREKVEHEWTLRTAAGSRTLAPFWWRGWFPWDWTAASAAEFAAPTLAGLLLAALLSHSTRGPHA